MLARGTSAGQSGQFHAERIRAVSDVNRDRVETVRGAVTATSGQTLVVENRAGESVVVTWTDATYCEGHGGQIRCDTIAVGDRVGAIGPADDDPAGFTARAIKKADDRHHFERLTGIVSSNQGHVMEVLTRDGTVNVHWDGDTKCHGLDGQIACDSIEPRMLIAAGGEELGERNFDAAVIKVLPVRDRLTDEVRDRLTDEARDRIRNLDIDDIDEDELRDRLEDAVRDRLGDDALDRDEIRDRIEDAIRDRLSDGSHDHGEDGHDDDIDDDDDHDVDDDSDDDDHDGEDHD
jgi:hypothetical protein